MLKKCLFKYNLFSDNNEDINLLLHVGDNGRVLFVVQEQQV